MKMGSKGRIQAGHPNGFSAPCQKESICTYKVGQVAFFYVDMNSDQSQVKPLNSKQKSSLFLPWSSVNSSGPFGEDGGGGEGSFRI